jgi:rRNA maturation endonuclease Nob1
VDQKLYKKTYPYICSNCGKFTHSKREFCESCGKKGAILNATKQDYKKAQI